MHLLLIGHSHISCIRTAYRVRLKENRVVPATMTTIALNEERFQPLCGPRGLNELLRAEIEATMAEDPVTATFLSVGGTAHAIIGLAEHPLAYRVRPQDVGEPGVQFVGETLMAAVLHERMARYEEALPDLLKCLPAPVFRLEPPPPSEDEAFVRASAPGHYCEAIAAAGVAPAQQRHLLWRLQSAIMERNALVAGAKYMKVPEEALDENGFLDPRGRHTDPVHANHWYGDHVLNQMSAVLAGVV